MNITVYSKPNCQPCRGTYRALDNAGLTYQVVDVSEDAEALEFIRSLGYQQSPVVVAGEDHWSGYNPQRVKDLAERLRNL